MSVMRVGWIISHSKSLESLATVELPEEGIERENQSFQGS